MKTINKEVLHNLYVERDLSLSETRKVLGISEKVVRRELTRHDIPVRQKGNNRQRTHGMHKERPYRIWQQMKNRCDNPKNINYKYYGAKGITYDKSWVNFINFYNDMKKGYNDNLTLDRIDNNKGYTRSNCRWVSYTVQNNNATSNIKKGSYTPKQLHELSSVSLTTIYDRIKKGWSVEKIINTPSLTRK